MKINRLLQLFKILLGINKLTKGEVIDYVGPGIDTYYFSNNTNVYPIKKTSQEITKENVETSYFSKNQLMNLLCTLSTYDGTIPEPTITIDLNGKDVPMWSGKSVLSYIIPKNINLTMKNNSYDTKSG